jgi:hypothetical protein
MAKQRKKATKAELIQVIMETRYKDDDSKYQSQNLAFLETLDIAELESMAYEDQLYVPEDGDFS